MSLVDTAGGGTGVEILDARGHHPPPLTEIDTIHGAVARLARRHKVATPTIDAMVAMVKGVQSTYLAGEATMDFALSEEQRLLVETARRFVRTELMPLEGELEQHARARPRQGAPSSRSRRRLASTPSTSRPNTAAAACRRSTPVSPRSSSATRPTS